MAGEPLFGWIWRTLIAAAASALLMYLVMRLLGRRRHEYEGLLNDLKAFVSGPPYYGAIYVADVERIFGQEIGQGKLQKFIKRMIGEGEVEEERDLLIFIKVVEIIGDMIVQEQERIASNLSSISNQIAELERRIKAAEGLRGTWANGAPELDVATYCVDFWSSLMGSYRQEIERLVDEKKRLQDTLERLKFIIKKSYRDSK